MSILHTAVSSHPSLRQAFSAACKLTGPFKLSATHRGTGDEHTFLVRRPYATVGRGAANDVRLNDPSVSRSHAFLQVVEGRVYCADLGSRTGIVWADGRSGPGWVGVDRSVRIGSFDLTVVHPTLPAGRRPPGSCPDATDRSVIDLPAASIEVYRGYDIPVGSCPLDWPVTLVGRHPSCRLRFVDSSVAYFQGCVVNTPDGIWWIDFSARPTSLVNGQRARISRLRDTDLLEIGRITLVPRRADAAAGPADGTLVRLTTTTAMVPPTADAGVSPLAVAEMMAQLRQCVASMAQTFATLQQEHAAAASEHLKQVQELTRELRQLRGESPPGAALPHKAAPALPPRAAPTQHVSSGADTATLTDAHAWFLGQLANLGQSADASPKRRG